MVGVVARAKRSVGAATRRVELPDGKFEFVEDTTRKAVQYGLSVLQPLQLEEAHAANLAEYRKARMAMEAFAALIDEMCNSVDALK